MADANRSRSGFFTTLSILIFLPAIIGCATSRIPSLQHQPDCETSVEGFFHCADMWDRAKPALIKRDGSEMKMFIGEIVSQDDKGVTFKPRKQGSLFEPNPEYFKFKDIEVLIDENGEVAYGIIPDQYSRAFALELHLTLLDEAEPKTIKLVLEPNRHFGFCVPPGNYVITEMLFRNDYHRIIDVGVDIPRLEVTVEQNRSNYVGDIYMDCGDLDRDDLIKIPYKIKHRPEQMNTVMGGMFGGAIGAAVAASFDDSELPEDVIGIHSIYVERDDEAGTKGKSAKVDNIITNND